MRLEVGTQMRCKSDEPGSPAAWLMPAPMKGTTRSRSWRDASTTSSSVIQVAASEPSTVGPTSGGASSAAASGGHRTRRFDWLRYLTVSPFVSWLAGPAHGVESSRDLGPVVEIETTFSGQHAPCRSDASTATTMVTGPSWGRVTRTGVRAVASRGGCCTKPSQKRCCTVAEVHVRAAV